MGKIKMPPRHLLCATPHKAFVESLPKFTEQTVRKHFSSFEQDGQESEAEEFTSPPVTNNKRRKLRKFYELHEMELFEDMRLIHQGKSFNAMCDIAKRQLPSIFLVRTKNDTFKQFPEQIAKAGAKDEVANKASAAREKAVIARKLKPDDHDISIEERQAEVEKIFAQKKSVEKRGGANNQVVPSAIFVGLAMVLWNQYLAGVPLTCSLALPIVVAYFRSHGGSNLLHSKQTSVPLKGTLRQAGLTPEANKIFWSKRIMNPFFRKIGLAMRKGTCNHGKTKTPE